MLIGLCVLQMRSTIRSCTKLSIFRNYVFPLVINKKLSCVTNADSIVITNVSCFLSRFIISNPILTEKGACV